jgi:hypothetical protein
MRGPRHARLAGWSALAALFLAANVVNVACTGGATSDNGTGASLRMSGAQFVRGAMPSGSSKGPSVLSIDVINGNIYPNLPNDPIGGALSPTATAVAVGLEGDVGYWLLVAGVPDVSTPTDPSFSGTMQFSGAIVPGTYSLVARAVDADGNFGPPTSQTLTATASPPIEPLPTGDLVVTLTWGNDANLDLHVVDPAGTDLFWGQPSTEPPFSFQQVDGGSYGTLDYDSNANCVIDGLDREDAVWKNPPASGTYVVRVDAASLCGEPIAYWSVTVTLDGKKIAEAEGTAVDADTRGSHGSGAGVTALTFDVP